MRILLSFILLILLFNTGTAQTPRFDHFDISKGLSQNNINGLVIDNKGNIWAGTLDGLNKYNGYEFEVFKPQAQGEGGISGNHLIEMGKGINGDIWITTRDGVLNQYQSSLQKFRHFENEIFSSKGIIPENNIVQFKGYNVTHLQFDELGNLWIDTQKNGINHFNYKKNQFLHYNWNATSLSRPDADPVRAICHRRNGHLWLGFDRNGVGIISPNGEQQFFSHYTTKTGNLNPINNVRSIFEDSEGNLWIGASNELCIFNEKLQQIEALNYRHNWQWPYHSYVLKEFEQGTLTITSNESIGLVDIKSMSLKANITLTNNDHFVPGSIRDIILDKKGHYWIAKNENGIIRAINWDEPFQVVQKQSHELTDNKVYCMLANGDSIWISTNSGLNLYSLKKEKIIKQYFERDGLCNNIVYSVHRDDSGIMWMSTNRGISRLNPKSENLKTYLPNDFFMDDAHFVDKEGRIFFGGYSGVVAFYPKDIKPLNVAARTTLENFKLFNQQILPGDTINKRVLLHKPVNQTPGIKLKHHENSFSFQFNAYPFEVSNQHIFRYRLSGIQEEWSTTHGMSRIANYTAIPPGNYIFEVQATFSQSNYGPLKKITIEIIPPFWQTIWFKVALILITIIAVFTGYHFRLQQIRKRNIFLKNQIEEQTRELRNRNKQIVEISEKLHEADQSKLRFFTNISHDFRTPLTLILAHIDNLDAAKNKAKKTIRNNALRLLSLVNQLIDLRKLEQGELALSVSEINIVAFTSEIVESFQILATKQEINLRFYSDVRKLDVWLDKDKIEKILNNLLSNALKYTPAGQSVMVTISENENDFSLSVEDTGIGMSEEEQQKIFERFYRTGKGQQNATGHGIGLPIVKGLTELQQGKISMKSEIDKGTKFTLSFSKGKMHYKKEDLKTEITEEIQIQNIKTTRAIKDFYRPGVKNILLVEDNDELSDYLKDLLDQWFNVKVAGNGRDAIKIMEGYRPELIISDVMMPVMDGIEFCHTVKADVRSSHIPFIILSARTDAETHIEGFELGADDYIEKPFDSKIFLKRVQALLDNREKIKEHIESTSSLQLNTKNLLQKDRVFFETTNRIIDSRLSEAGFNIEKLSNQMNMSRSTFYRKFKTLTGLSAAEYLRSMRLRKALKHLKEGIPVSQVAELVGFQSIAHFRKCFKDEFGKTPGNWHYF
jgi:signal transduction histidine kinase/DNA-binding response OmpR family regulator/ligand-binding sensor domain-containing protein